MNVNNRKRKLAVFSVVSAASSLTSMLADDDDVEVVEAANSLFDGQSLTAVAIAQQTLDGRASVGERCSVLGFVDCTVPNYSLSEFREHFRMSRYCYEVNFQFYVAYKLDP